MFLLKPNPSACAAGGVCPTVDPHVLPLPCRPLLHHLVCPFSSLHRHHRWATADSHHHGDQLDDHCRAPPHIWGKCWWQIHLRITILWIWGRVVGTGQNLVFRTTCLWCVKMCPLRSYWCTSWTVTTVWATCACSCHSGFLCSHSWPQHLGRKGGTTVSI